MEEIFENLFVFIPIAFVIALRVMGAQNKRKQNRPVQRSDTGPFPPRPAVPGRTGQAAAKKVPVKKAAPKKPPRKVEPSAAAVQGIPQPSVPPVNPQPGANPAPKETPAIARLTELQGKLSPLRMGVVWAEILGPPRANDLP